MLSRTIRRHRLDDCGRRRTPMSQPAVPPALWWDGPAQRFAGSTRRRHAFVEPIRLRAGMFIAPMGEVGRFTACAGAARFTVETPEARSGKSEPGRPAP